MAKKTSKKTQSSGNKAIDFPVENSFGFLLRKSYQTFVKSLEEKIALYNVTTPQWFFLRVLWEEDGITQRELSEKVGITESTTVAAMKVMQRRGFVRCTSDKKDKRRKKVYLTKAGRDLRNDLLPHAYLVHMMSKEGLSEEQVKSTRETILHMKKNLEVDDETRKLLEEIRSLKSQLKQ